MTIARCLFLVIPRQAGILHASEIRFHVGSAFGGELIHILPHTLAGIKPRNHFAELKVIGPQLPIKEFQERYRRARERLEKANSEAYTTPEWCFMKAQQKINAGDYPFDKAIPDV